MLIQFKLKNYRSFQNEGVFSMLKGRGDELPDNFFSPSAPAVDPLLHSAAIYGANASGKTSLVRGLWTMRGIVRSSASREEGETMDLTPFLLDQKTKNGPSEFEVIFLTEGVKYQYGFSASEKQIFDEWLYFYPKGRPRCLFTREWNEGRGDFDWKTPALKGGRQKQLWRESTRPDALFLSTGTLLNSQDLKKVSDWFSKRLVLGNFWHKGSITASRYEKTQDAKITDFIQKADFDVANLRVNKHKITDADLENLPDEVKELLKDEEVFEVGFVHKGHKGEDVVIGLDDESDGTRKIFGYATPILDALKYGQIVLVDELAEHLHPLLMRHLIRYFQNPKTNPNHAQLIFTTHDTSIMDSEFLRRDQIWFCEKDKKQATDLFSLADFKARPGREDWEKYYLSGRYGALPYLKKEG